MRRGTSASCGSQTPGLRRYCYRDDDGAERGDLGVTAFNARTESFVTLLLDVSGRARPSDIQGVSPAEAVEVLQAYAAAHAAEGVRFDGDELVIAPTPVSAAPVAEAFGSAAAYDAPAMEQQPVAMPDPEQLPSWMFEGEASAPPVSAAAPAAATIPDHESALFEGMPAAPAVAAEQVDDGGPISNDFVNLPPLEDAADAAGEKPGRKGASPLLLVLIVILVLVAGAAAAYYLGALEMLGLGLG